MSRLRLLSLASAVALISSSGFSAAEMLALDDDSLSGVSGQAGVVLDAESKLTIAEVAYFDDGNGIAFQGIRFGAADPAEELSEIRYVLDILETGSLQVQMSSSNVSRFEIEEIRFVDAPGVASVADAPSLGGFFFDFDVSGSVIVQNSGNGTRGAYNAAGGVYDIDLVFSDAKLGYRTNGNELLLDGVTIDIDSAGTLLGANNAGELVFEAPDLNLELSAEAIRFSNNPLNHGVSNDDGTGTPLPSLGSLWVNLDANTAWRATAGGRDGVEGLAINSTTTFDRLDIAYGDDTDFANNGYWLGALGITGQLDVTNLTLDILDDPDAATLPSRDYGFGVALQFDQLVANLRVQDVVLGTTKTQIDDYVSGSSAPINSIGGFGINLLLEDALYDGNAYSNAIYIQAGGNADAGYQGIRLDTQLSVASPNNESNLVYFDDGNALMLSGLEAFVDGDITLDITRSGTLGTTEFYDGLRLGFEDVAFGYRVEGVRAGVDSNTVAVESQELQGAFSQPNLLGLGSPAMEGNLNGQITIGPGGNVGTEGLTINADLEVSDGTIASFVNGSGDGRGIWLSGLNYDVHLRDLMLDVTADGLQIFESESWSNLDVTDFRVGDKATGASFGRLALSTFERGSTTAISAGGAGTICIGGSGADQTACETAGGRWEDRGQQGITIETRRFFQAAEGAKRNQFIWETARNGEGTATPINGTGQQLVFDNFSTNDADGTGNDTYGFRTDYNIDVANAYVVKKEDGADSNGIVGNKGDVKVMTGAGTYIYVDPASLTAADRDNLPVGIALRTRTHFQELNFDQVRLRHPTGEDSTLLYGLKLQNFDVTTDITATPLN